jgi:precorrin-2 methylase
MQLVARKISSTSAIDPLLPSATGRFAETRLASEELSAEEVVPISSWLGCAPRERVPLRERQCSASVAEETARRNASTCSLLGAGR